MIKYRTASDNIYNSISVFFSALAFLILIIYQLYLLFNRDMMGFNMLYNVFAVAEIAFLCAGAFFSFKQLVRNRHVETVTAAILLVASLLNFIVINNLI